MSLFDPNSIKQNDKEKVEKQKKYQEIENWCLNLVKEQNKEVENKEIQIDMNQCVLSVQEVSCGDPNCSPFDTIITFAFHSGGQGMLTLPLFAKEVTKDDIDEIFPPNAVILKWINNEEVEWPPVEEPEPLRFGIGTEVLCRVGPTEWKEGHIIELWYRESSWPEWVHAPYKVQLDDGRQIFAPQDMDQIVKINPNRTSSSSQTATTTTDAAVAVDATTANATATAPGSFDDSTTSTKANTSTSRPISQEFDSQSRPAAAE